MDSDPKHPVHLGRHRQAGGQSVPRHYRLAIGDGSPFFDPTGHLWSTRRGLKLVWYVQNQPLLEQWRNTMRGGIG